MAPAVVGPVPAAVPARARRQVAAEADRGAASSPVAPRAAGSPAVAPAYPGRSVPERRAVLRREFQGSAVDRWAWVVTKARRAVRDTGHLRRRGRGSGRCRHTAWGFRAA